LIFSGTRSGWVGTFMGVLFLSIFVVLKRKALWKKWSALLLSFVLIIAVINSLEKGSYVNRINSVVTDSYHIASNQSTGHEGSNRFFIWEKAFPLLKTYFLIGSGPDTLQYVFKAKPAELEQYFGSSNVIVDKAHNEYLQMAITLGLPALIIYLLLVSLVVIRTYKAARDSQGNDKIFFFGLLSVIFGYLVQAFFNISVVPVAPLYWSVLGMTLAQSELYLQKNQAAKIMKVHNQSA
jgi:O-antigen ligase